ncbi:MAG TPA: hypothetical protein VGW75_15710 [Solirubrobacteraceae bacterium]|jgi:hypothetical protein|nr:hypothetical protein [Solirubrobacteraceae bacterium]
MRRLERRLLRKIAIATVVTGATQAVAPAVSLSLLRGDDTPTARHFFGTVGMFMVCTGGLAAARPDDRAVTLMTVAQKAGAAAAVGLAVRRGLLSPLALGVAGFDAFTSVLALDYVRRLG